MHAFEDMCQGAWEVAGVEHVMEYDSIFLLATP